MGTISHKKNVHSVQPVHSPAVLLIGTIADTSWRMFIPTIAGILIGVWVDGMLASKPLGLIIGVVFGFAIAGGLVMRQIKRGDQ